MKPPPFRYERADSLGDALALLDSDELEAKPLAGGQSLVSLMNLRLARPDVLVDLAPIDELRYTRVSDEGVEVGALTTQADLLADTAAMSACPMLAEALPHLGHGAIRNRGTVGGSIAHADPAAELPVVLAALGGAVTVRSVSGERTVDASELFAGFLQTSLEPNEILTGVSFPAGKQDSRAAFVEFARRPGDFALVSVGVLARGNGTVEEARIALGGVAMAPVVLEGTDDLAGMSPEAAGAKAAEIADGSVAPTGDIHGSAEYRAHLVRELVKRAMSRAFNRDREDG